jgi:hypothetical protein
MAETTERPIAYAVVTVRMRLRIPKERIDGIVSPEDSYESALIAVEEWIKDDLPGALEYMDQAEPEVEADA